MVKWIPAEKLTDAIYVIINVTIFNQGSATINLPSRNLQVENITRHRLFPTQPILFPRNKKVIAEYTFTLLDQES